MSDIFILKNEEEDDKISSSKPRTQQTLLEKMNESLLGMQSLKIQQKVLFYRMLATMVNAGISLLKSISILEKQEVNPVAKKIYASFLVRLKEGASLSQCLEDFPASFDSAEIGIIESGEKTGKLKDALLTLAGQVEKMSSLSGKIKSALMYPAMIVLVVFGVVFVMMTMVVPKLIEIFADSANLPLATRILIKVSDVFVNFWYLILGGLIGAYIVFMFWKNTPRGKYQFDNIMLRFPVFGNISKKIILSKFSRVLSELMSSGVSIVESLRITASSLGNEVYKERILLVRKDVQQGLKMYEALEGDSLFPIMFVQMLQVGEQTAQVDKIILKIADFYEEEVDNLVGMINKLLEPFIIVFMAVVVGFIAVAIMEPIMNLANTMTESIIFL